MHNYILLKMIDGLLSAASWNNTLNITAKEVPLSFKVSGAVTQISHFVF